MPLPKVVLAVGMGSAFGRGLLRGVRSFVRQHGPWSVAPGVPWQQALANDYDGLIAQVTNPAAGPAILARGKPAVNVSNAVASIALPRISSDDEAVGRLGAEHFIAAGYRRVGFCGFGWTSERHTYARLRGEGFLARAAEAGLETHCFDLERATGPNADSDADRQKVQEWLVGLPKPIAVMGANDVRGRHVINAAQAAGLRVPEHVAVLGVDNDEVDCEMAELPLSSIPLDLVHIGFEAARALAQLMAGGSAQNLRIAPRPVVVRQSSDILAIDDPAVASAVTFIRARANRRLLVSEVADAVMLSRRALERRFRAALGFAPHEEIRRCQIVRARELLSETFLSMSEIAEASGFRDAKTLSTVFHEETGEPPTAYRKRFRTSR